MKYFVPFFPKLLLINLLLLFCLFLRANSITAPVDQRFSSSETEIPTFIKFNEGEEPLLVDLNSVFAPYWKNAAFDFELIGRENDLLGQVHFRFNQTYNGIPIEFAEIIAHTKNGRILSINGQVLDQVPSNQLQSLTEHAALKAALDYINAESYKWELEAEEMHLKTEQNNQQSSYFPEGRVVYISNSTSIASEELTLAYAFNIYAQKPLSRREIYISAENGKVLFENNLIHTANVKGTATTVYSGKQTINTDSTATNSFRLRQTVSGNGINTYDMGRGTNYSNSSDFTDSDNSWNNVNTNLDEYATDAHWGAEQTYAYFDSLFGRNSINDNGFTLNSYIHYSTNYVNAFWDGQRMTYGDGNVNVDPLVSLDIAGHEITHGLTTFSANLVYQSESGALNESFSDIFGTAIEFFGKSSSANWTVGEDVGLTLRSLANPNAYRDPDTYGGTYWRAVTGCVPSQQNDQCGVHTNSGVQNFWFYLLTNGGTGTNDNNDSYSVSGLGIDTAAAIAYRNLTVYLTRTSDYEDARYYSIVSAVDLYGPCSKQVEAVSNAWHAVGVGAAYIPGVQSDFVSVDTAQCKPPYVVNFQNKSNNGTSYHWDFGDGDTSNAQNPIHQYVSYGAFDVKLIAKGGSCGTDTVTFTDYIDIDSSNTCVLNLQSGINPTQLECNATLFDSGGKGGNYKNNELAIITIAPPNAATVTIDFKQFDVEAGTNGACNFDYLEIFDGTSTSSPSLGLFCNSNGSPGTITSSRGAITIKFKSDPGLTKGGFEMDWNCNYPTSKPVADFLTSDDTSCTGTVKFQDYSTNAPSSLFWDFGDGNTSIQANPSHTYTANGSYTIKLISTNNFGSDTITKLNEVVVDRPQKATATNDTICPNQQASLTASGQGILNWYLTEVGGNALYSGTNFNTNNIRVDSSFWVEDYIPAPVETLGPSDNTIGSGRYFSGDQHLIFDVFEKVELVSVRVYAGSSGNRTFELRDSSGVVLQSYSRYVPSGSMRVNLNFDLLPGKNYQLGVSALAGGPDLYRNNGGVSYPYNLTGKISIKSSSANSNPTGFYYFFYNWRLKGDDCRAERKEVKVVIDTTCAITGITSLANSQIGVQLYPNPVSNRLNLIVSEASSFTEVEVLSLQAKRIGISYIQHKNKLIFDTSSLSNGIYFIRLQTEDETITKKFIVNH